jgi:hypothetical protein
MKRIVLFSKEMSNDRNQMEKAILEAAQKDHPSGQLCTSGVSLEFRREEEAMNFVNQPETEVLRLDTKSGKLVSFEKKYQRQ